MNPSHSPLPESRPPPRPLPDAPVLPTSFVVLTAALVVVPNIVLAITMVARSAIHLGAWIWIVHSGVLGLTIFLALLAYRTDRARLQRLLRENSHNLCPRCRYPLSTLTPSPQTDRCPECGTLNDPAAISALWTRWESLHKQ